MLFSQVEFAPPVGYKEKEHETSGNGGAGGSQGNQQEDDLAALMPEPRGFIAFKGEGNRLDGKKKKPGKDNSQEDNLKLRQVRRL